MTIQARILCAIAVSGFAALAATSPALALTAQECSAKYQAAKTAGTLNGQKWNDFRKAECGPGATQRRQRIRGIDWLRGIGFRQLAPVLAQDQAGIQHRARNAVRQALSGIAHRDVDVLSAGILTDEAGVVDGVDRVRA